MGIKLTNKKYYWYCGDILDYNELCKATLEDTGESPYIPYIDKYWKASVIDVIIYKLKCYFSNLKKRINEKLD